LKNISDGAAFMPLLLWPEYLTAMFQSLTGGFG